MRLTNPTFPSLIGLAVVLAGLTTSAQTPNLLKVAAKPQAPAAKKPASLSVLDARPAGVAPQLDLTKMETVIERYPNGNVKVERKVVLDEEANYVNHGTYTMYDPDGKVLKKGEFQAGKQHGKWTQCFAEDKGHLISGEQQKEFQGPFVSEATFADGKIQGPWTIKDASGQNVVEWNFYHGARGGKSTWWHSNGQKWLEANYENGVLDGELTEWDRDGKLVSQATYIGGRYLAKEVGWYALGHKHFEGAYLRVSTVPEPTYDWWTGTATPPTATPTGEDQKHGLWTSWYQNGNKKTEGKYDHNVPSGKFTWWYENGQKQAEGEYEAGQKYGIWITLYPNGLKESQITYVEGKPIGTSMRWDADGKLAGMRDYDDKGHARDVPLERPKTSERPSKATRSR